MCVYTMCWLYMYRHTGVVVYGQEFFFGGMGIESCNPVSLLLFICKHSMIYPPCLVLPDPYRVEQSWDNPPKLKQWETQKFLLRFSLNTFTVFLLNLCKSLWSCHKGSQSTQICFNLGLPNTICWSTIVTTFPMRLPSS